MTFDVAASVFFLTIEVLRRSGAMCWNAIAGGFLLVCMSCDRGDFLTYLCLKPEASMQYESIKIKNKKSKMRRPPVNTSVHGTTVQPPSLSLQSSWGSNLNILQQRQSIKTGSLLGLTNP